MAIELYFPENITLVTDSEALHVDGHMIRHSFRRPSAGVRQVLTALAGDGISRSDMTAIITQHDGISGIFTLMPHLNRLMNIGLIAQRLYDGETVFAQLIPSSAYFRTTNATITPDQTWVLSRFACITREDQHMLLSNPLAHARIELVDPRALSVLALLNQPISLAELAARFPDSPDELLQDFFRFLQITHAISPVIDGRSAEEANDTLRQWEFHDLLFHSKVRVGRSNSPYGGTYRFVGEIEQPPMAKHIATDTIITLPQPDLQAIRASDRSFAEVLESRTSRRRHHPEQAITLQQLSEFLYRSARIRQEYQSDLEFNGQIAHVHHSNRPYPSGGASYELELYLSITHCEGVEAGFYHYDPQHHRLEKVSGITPSVQHLLRDAQRAWIREYDGSSPQVLITYAARFQRVSWKYSSIAYAIILKNVGALMQTMSLTAEAMGLAGSPLGAGNADIFTQALGEDYYAEGSVGEFILGVWSGQD